MWNTFNSRAGLVSRYPAMGMFSPQPQAQSGGNMAPQPSGAALGSISMPQAPVFTTGGNTAPSVSAPVPDSMQPIFTTGQPTSAQAPQLGPQTLGLPGGNMAPPTQLGPQTTGMPMNSSGQRDATGAWVNHPLLGGAGTPQNPVPFGGAGMPTNTPVPFGGVPSPQTNSLGLFGAFK